MILHSYSVPYFRDAELVEHDLLLRIRHLLAGRRDVGRPHIHRDPLEGSTRLWTQILVVPLEGLLLAGHWTRPGGGVAGVVRSGMRTTGMVLGST